MVHEFHGGDEMAKKSKRSKKATKKSKRSKVTIKPVKATRAATKSDRSKITSATPATIPAATPATRSTEARTNIAEGTRLYALAGRPTKADFMKVYGPKGPKMTWAQRAEAGVDAKHFQGALKAKS
jgi:hypothetical protein